MLANISSSSNGCSKQAAAQALPGSAAAATAAATAAPSIIPGAYAARHYLHEKAGMGGVSKEHVAKVVAEMSVGSKYAANAARQEAALEARLVPLREALAKSTAHDISRLAGLMDSAAAKLEACRNLTRVRVHIDFDAFFAACEELAQPHLRGTAFAVGGMGMISTASYEARKFGVRSAMPGFVGKQLCPHLVLVPHHGELYTAAAEAARAVFVEYDAEYASGMSMDEASLDITNYLLKTGVLSVDETSSSSSSSSSERVPMTPDVVNAICSTVSALRERVRVATGGLTVSAGIAANRLLAKIASDVNKPNGQFFVPFARADIVAFLGPLSARKIPGVGRVTERMLRELGVETVNDIFTHRGQIRAVFNERTSLWLLNCALGISESDLNDDAPEKDDTEGLGRKSVSQERTFPDCGSWPRLLDVIQTCAAAVGKHLAKEDIVGRTITLKMKRATFEVQQRSVTISTPTNSGEEIESIAISLLRSAWPVKLRLLGIRLSNLSSAHPAPTLLDTFTTNRQPKAESFGLLGDEQEGDGDDDDEDDVVILDESATSAAAAVAAPSAITSSSSTAAAAAAARSDTSLKEINGGSYSSSSSAHFSEVKWAAAAAYGAPAAVATAAASVSRSAASSASAAAFASASSMKSTAQKSVGLGAVSGLKREMNGLLFLPSAASSSSISGGGKSNSSSSSSSAPKKKKPRKMTLDAYLVSGHAGKKNSTIVTHSDECVDLTLDDDDDDAGCPPSLKFTSSSSSRGTNCGSSIMGVRDDMEISVIDGDDDENDPDSELIVIDDDDEDEDGDGDGDDGMSRDSDGKEEG